MAKSKKRKIKLSSQNCYQYYKCMKPVDILTSKFHPNHSLEPIKLEGGRRTDNKGSGG